MSRPTLTLARASKPTITFARLRKAAKQFRGSYVPKAERRALILKWLIAVDRLGDKSLLATPVKRRVA